MDAKKCDRCGNFYKTLTVFRKYNVISTRLYVKNTLDLCPECYDALASFLKNEQHDNSVKENTLE